MGWFSSDKKDPEIPVPGRPKADNSGTVSEESKKKAEAAAAALKSAGQGGFQDAVNKRKKMLDDI